MINKSREIVASVALALAPIGASNAGDINPWPDNACTLEYQRADNSFAAPGRPDGNLGVETITLQPGQSKVFVTDWRYEKKRNDGTNYYGSHLRIATNRGQSPVRLNIRYGVGGSITYWLTLDPGAGPKALQADLMEVNCPKS